MNRAAVAQKQVSQIKILFLVLNVQVTCKQCKIRLDYLFPFIMHIVIRLVEIITTITFFTFKSPFLMEKNLKNREDRKNDFYCETDFFKVLLQDGRWLDKGFDLILKHKQNAFVSDFVYENFLIDHLK
jgi:hypothetical protein